MANKWIENLPGPRLATLVEEKGDALMARYHTDDVYFAVWLHALNRVVQSRVLLSYDDLEDWDYWSAYDGDMTPKEAALQMLDDAGYSYDEAL